MVEQWNSESEVWWNSGTVIVKGGGTVAQCHNDSKGGDKETSEMFILDFRIPYRRKKQPIKGLPETDALHLAVTGENKR